MFHGTQPLLVDHINGKPDDDRIENLQALTYAENIWKARVRKNKSGYTGVYKTKYGWMAFITVNYKKIYLGTYKTPDEARMAYINAKLVHHNGFMPIL